MVAVSSKKVILFIVEGPTDEDTLSPIFKKLFQNAQVRFHVVHGDISTDLSVSSRNVLKTVNDHIKKEMKRYGFMRNDIIRVIHLVDMDGAFIPNANIVAGMMDKLQYEEDCIVTRRVSQTIARNERKQGVLYRLFPTKKIGGSPYAVYYFSRNLEHVLYNECGDLTDDEKIDYADQGADAYSDDPEGFVRFLSNSDFAVSGNYNETWQFIFKGTNSLHRHCNVHLLFP